MHTVKDAVEPGKNPFSLLSDFKRASKPNREAILCAELDTKTPQTQPRGSLTFWRSIPLEIKIRIFACLEPEEIVRSSRVSRDWHRVCYEGQLWDKFDVGDFAHPIPADAVATIITRAGNFLCDLNLRGCVRLDKLWQGRALLDTCMNLRSLSLRSCLIDGTTIHRFLHGKGRLVHIDLSHHASVTNTAMHVIAVSCPKLKTLDISHCDNINTCGLQEVVAACPELTSIQASEIGGWENGELMQRLFLRNNLERLVLKNCDSLTDESLTILIQGSNGKMGLLTPEPIVPPRKLRHLDLARCRGISNRGVETLVNNIPNIETLNFSKCLGIGDEALIQLLPTTPLLIELDLEELDLLTNAVLHGLASSPCARHLRHLRVTDCERMDDVGMLALLQSCTGLWSLEMDSTRISDLVLVEAAAMVSRRAPRTVTTADALYTPTVGLSLSVRDCFDVTWVGIREILSRNASVVTKIATVKVPQPMGHSGGSIRKATKFSLFQSSPSEQSPPSCSASPDIHNIYVHAYPTHIVKIFTEVYKYQSTVQEHTDRVLRGDFPAARRLEHKWAEFIVAREAIDEGGVRSWRKRLRARNVQRIYTEEESGTVDIGIDVVKRWSTRSGSCALM
jgi:F-box/leucine-rich repeat protein 2/20